MKVLNKSREYLFLLGVLTLPIYQTLNHWFFGGFLALSILILLADKDSVKVLLSQKILIFGIALFLVLKGIGIFSAINYDYGIKEAVRSLPFFLYPISIVSFKSKTFNFKRFEKKVFYALSYGCFITAIICWSYIISLLKHDDIAANRFFGWKKSGSYLTQILDVHPPYLGLLIVASIVFLMKEIFFNHEIKTNKKYFNIFISFTLLVFLFNITARNALFFLAVLSFAFLVYKKYWKLIVIPITLILITVFLIINHPSEYYRLKMYYMLNLTDDDVKDRRFERLKASYEVFKTSPLTGVGLGYDNELKIEQYKLMKDEIAAQKRLNSHNQFFEYLAAFGIFGGAIFIGVNILFVIVLIRNQQYFYLILFSHILIASLTESIFERALGIQYYAVLASIIILSLSSLNEHEKCLNE